MIPQRYRAAMRLWPQYRAETAAAGKRALIARFVEWLKKRPRPVAVDAAFGKWRASYERQRRRFESGK